MATKKIKETGTPDEKVKETVGSEKDKETVSRSLYKKKPLKQPKKSGNGKNSPMIGENGLKTNKGDTSKYLEINMRLFNMEKIDQCDRQAVQDRILEYFGLYAEFDTKPTVQGLAIALGMSRRTLYGITHDLPITGWGNYSKLPSDITNDIKNAYYLLENLWETYMQNGKINPVSGIFLGKNNFGYQDKVEHVVTPNVKTEEDYSVDEIKKRYGNSSDYEKLSD